MELAELYKYKNKIFNIVAVIVAVMIVFNFIYKRQLKEIESLKEKKDTEIKKNEVLEDISKLEKKINAYKNLLTKKDGSSIINSISNMAKESAVKIISIKPNQEQIFTNYVKFSFDLTVNTANYHALGRFISRLESDHGVYIIDAVDIKPESQTKELVVNLKLSNIVFAD